MHISVNQNGLLVAVRVFSPACARKSVVDRFFGARVVELFPQVHDEVGVPPSLVGTGW
jgi:hypothetical protein